MLLILYNCHKYKKYIGGRYMISFFVCLAILIIGFMLYSKVAEKVFGPDDRKPPALSMTDGSDYVPMGTPRIFLIQLLNIAGLGPIFGHYFTTLEEKRICFLN